jgi:hypothetical protein
VFELILLRFAMHADRIYPIDDGRIEPKDLRLERGCQGRILVSFLEFLGNLKGTKSLNLILG